MIAICLRVYALIWHSTCPFNLRAPLLIVMSWPAVALNAGEDNSYRPRYRDGTDAGFDAATAADISARNA